MIGDSDNSPPLGLRPYVVSADGALLTRVAARDYVVQHAFSAAGEAWFEALRALDQLIFQSSGMVLPGWVFFDCALAPGFVAGLVEGPSVATSDAAEPRPVSLGIAIPTADPALQLVHSLGAVEGAPAGTLAATWELVVDLLDWDPRAGGALMTAGWGTAAERLISGRGQAAILAAYMPAHDQPMTAMLGLGPRFSAVPQGTTCSQLTCDEAGLRALQAALDAGASAWILGLEPVAGAAPETRRIAVLAGPTEAR